MYTHLSATPRYRSLIGSILIVIFLALTLLPAPSAHAATNRAEPRISLAFSAASDPSGATANPGDMLTLKTRVDNIGQIDARDVVITFTYRPEFALVQENTVNQVSTSQFIVAFGYQSAGTFSAHEVQMMVRPEMQAPAQVIVRSELSWWDAYGSYTIPGPTIVLAIGQNIVRTAAANSTVDNDQPTSQIACMRFDGNGVAVRWQGQDTTSTVAAYRVQVRQLPNGYWRSWKETADAQAWFGPLEGKSFTFKVQAEDAWGNLGNWSPEVTTEMLTSGAVPTCGK